MVDPAPVDGKLEPLSASDVLPAATSTPVGGRAKRTIDLVLAGLALVALLPALALIAVLIRVTMGAPVLYFHERVGLNGRRFNCFKFRTMVINGDEVLQRHLAQDAEADKEWRRTRKLRRDPRVTTLGRILRASSLDELPQLINILRGDMSCVGPRPVTLLELKRYGLSADAYLSARPGLTGLWQVSGRNSLPYEQRVRLDAAYVRDWRLATDLVIILRTVPALLRSSETS